MTRAPEACTTGAQRATSRAMKSWYAAGDNLPTVPPSSAKRARNAGSASTARISRLSRSTTAGGSPAGPEIPNG